MDRHTFLIGSESAIASAGVIDLSNIGIGVLSPEYEVRKVTEISFHMINKKPENNVIRTLKIMRNRNENPILGAITSPEGFFNWIARDRIHEIIIPRNDYLRIVVDPPTQWAYAVILSDTRENMIGETIQWEDDGVARVQEWQGVRLVPESVPPVDDPQPSVVIWCWDAFHALRNFFGLKDAAG